MPRSHRRDGSGANQVSSKDGQRVSGGEGLCCGDTARRDNGNPPWVRSRDGLACESVPRPRRYRQQTSRAREREAESDEWMWVGVMSQLFEDRLFLGGFPEYVPMIWLGRWIPTVLRSDQIRSDQIGSDRSPDTRHAMPCYATATAAATAAGNTTTDQTTCGLGRRFPAHSASVRIREHMYPSVYHISGPIHHIHHPTLSTWVAAAPVLRALRPSALRCRPTGRLSGCLCPPSAPPTTPVPRT